MRDFEFWILDCGSSPSRGRAQRRPGSALIALAIAILLCIFASPAHAEDAAALIKSAAQAMKAGEFNQAITAYEKARELMPQSAEIPYNLGVAQYRAGEFEKAAESFKQATSLANDGSLRSRSIYNLGNAAYAQSLKALNEQGDPTQGATQLNQATDLLKQAVDHYKKAIDASGGKDEDARANAELSHRLLKQLQELQQQMQQQQQQNGEQEQDSENQQQQQQGDQQQQQQQEQQDQAGQQQQQSQSGEEQQQQQQQSAAGTESDQEQDKTEQQRAETGQEQLEEKENAAAKSEKSDNQAPEKKTMTREEADRLLQAVRDKERKRRAELARREAAKYAPVEKDW